VQIETKDKKKPEEQSQKKVNIKFPQIEEDKKQSY
jgi:hypothetical protein